ncbi:hypothetical protein [Streptomyces sp. 1222.5]|uniref:hypothetical protein n=1 Tax=Streptomyces sp. 1222.5 TaxID=1881026 RepID=UPI003D702678
MTLTAVCPLCRIPQDAQHVEVARVDGYVRYLVQCSACQHVWALPRSRRQTTDGSSA